MLSVVLWAFYRALLHLAGRGGMLQLGRVQQEGPTKRNYKHPKIQKVISNSCCTDSARHAPVSMPAVHGCTAVVGTLDMSNVQQIAAAGYVILV